MLQRLHERLWRQTQWSHELHVPSEQRTETGAKQQSGLSYARWTTRASKPRFSPLMVALLALLASLTLASLTNELSSFPQCHEVPCALVHGEVGSVYAARQDLVVTKAPL
eukprot:2922523-Amphidinium_carterae.1